MILFKRLSLAIAITALIAGCSSGVKLDETPVTDAGAASTGQGAGSGSTSQSGVSGVDLSASASDKDGPQGVSRIVYFDFDSYAIRADAQAQVEAHARFLKASQSRKVQIEGHTDERGGREYNLALGQKRAEAVRRALGLLGVQESQMEAVSYGKEKPAVEGNTEDAFAQNRRAELSYR
ncbi:peptidoglycan-associated lipoprotein Pal [Comamonas composti]|uniref:peptidoglycan-associated lipoprotein Pal n=1 Tax=Comamonas composti TaxID=408558 RepID=UPI00040E6F3D|nr:peptidoglycan-associated lipoprotein Pal [Comamonas composti]